jgi:CheY-like chemotaxis protein
MIKIHSGTPIPRYQIFVLGDGNYVVQWTETTVQDLLTGAFREYRFREFGHRISDTELERLKASHVIEDFDQTYIWIYALPEDQRYNGQRTLQSKRVRSYYINTTLTADKLSEIQACLDALPLGEDFCACIHEGLVAVLGKDAAPFRNLRDAETAQRKLQSQLPQLLENAALAFTENEREFAPGAAESDDDEYIDLDALIASQTDTTMTQGKYAVVAVTDDSERRSIMMLLSNMQMAAVGAKTGTEALCLLEEEPVDVLIADAHLADMHAWAMLGRFREISHADHTRVIVLADPEADDQVFALTVAKVDVYLPKPISMAHLRQSVWSALKEHAAG